MLFIQPKLESLGMAFYKYLKFHAEKQPDSAAIIEGDSTVTYSEFCKQVESFA